VNRDLLAESMADNPLLAVYAGGVVMSVTMLAALLIGYPEVMRAALNEAVTLTGLSRPAVITVGTAAYSLGWPISLPLVLALARKAARMTRGRHGEGERVAGGHLDRSLHDWVRQLWDLTERAVAARLDMIEAGWLVGYSLGRREYYAIARWDVPQALIVRATTPDNLQKLMRQAERPDPPGYRTVRAS
jgi:hypothetical protein